MRYAMVCAIARDEVPAVRDWVLYHMAIGFEHILIYDNGNSPPLSEVLREDCASGLVSVLPFPSRNSPQLSAYFHCLENYRGKVRWIAFLDLDEYLVPLAHTDIRDFLDEYRDCAALGVSWRVFGSNGHIVRPKLSVPRAYTHVLRESNHIKSIVDPAKTNRPFSPHHFGYVQGSWCVNEDRFPIPGAVSYPTFKRIQLNHYYYRSQQDYAAKIARGLATPVKNVSGYTWEPFYAQAEVQGTEDLAATRFCRLSELLARLPAGERAARVLEDACLPLSDILVRLSEQITRQDFAAAEKLFRRARRYHLDPLLFVLGARLARWRGNDAEAFALLREIILSSELSPRHKGQIYAALAEQYAHAGDEATARSAAAFGDTQENGKRA